VTSTIKRLREILVALIKATLLGESYQTRSDHHSLKSLRVRELQMDWLRSEDLKEEKNVTAPIVIIASVVAKSWRGVLLGMRPMNRFATDRSSHRSVGTDMQWEGNKPGGRTTGLLGGSCFRRDDRDGGLLPTVKTMAVLGGCTGPRLIPLPPGPRFALI
jgi:hypothetical protein